MKITEAVFGVPEHWPKRYNANTDPCDFIQGPCACGAWHFIDEEWVIVGLQKFGLRKKES